MRMMTAIMNWKTICTIVTFDWVLSIYTAPIKTIHLIPSQKPTSSCVGDLKYKWTSGKPYLCEASKRKP